MTMPAILNLRRLWTETRQIKQSLKWERTKQAKPVTSNPKSEKTLNRDKTNEAVSEGRRDKTGNIWNWEGLKRQGAKEGKTEQAFLKTGTTQIKQSQKRERTKPKKTGTENDWAGKVQKRDRRNRQFLKQAISPNWYKQKLITYKTVMSSNILNMFNQKELGGVDKYILWQT